MRLQPKSLISTLPLGRGNRKSDAAAATSTEPEQTLGPNLQSLAAELHQAALSGVFDYPRNWLIAIRVAMGLLLVASFVQLLLTVGSILRQPGSEWSDLFTFSVAGAGLGMVLAAVASAFVFNVFTSLQVTPQGLGVSEMFGWRRVAWKDIGVLRVMELPSKGRYVVMVPFKKGAKVGGPGPMLKLLPRLAGAAQSGERGVVITSDLKNFERLLQLIVSYLGQAAGQVVPTIETLVDEETVMPVAQVLLEPEAALARLSRNKQADADFYGVTVADTEPVVPWPKTIARQALVAAAPVVLMLADVLRRDAERPVAPIHLVWALGLLFIGVMELPFVAGVVQGVGELMVGSGKYKRAVLAYMELQVPRALLVFLGAAAIGVGLPAAIGWALWAVGIMITTVFTTRYVQKMYFLPITPALLAGVCTFIFQASLMALYFAVR